ncbi:MAG TPA: HDOD domain-containing protein [Candidatus Acidoferrales bacterium]|nr:HDOD domain-containing protein [Candidatus Acidoferrales bacterium]
MPIALDDPSRSPSDRKINPSESSQKTYSSRRRHAHEGLNRLTDLLVSAPIDLASISDEIRRHCGLADLVLRLGVSLVLSPDEPLTTVEEAVVVLGTSRLRMLIDIWSSADAPVTESAVAVPKAIASAPKTADATPEMRYIANFLRCLGSDSPEGTFSRTRLAAWASKVPPDQMGTLTDLFMHDFFSLLPIIQPNIREFAAPQGSSTPHPVAIK